MANSETNAAAQEKTGFVRSMLLVIFLLGSIGTGIELLLLGHTEELWQLTPLTLITISVTIALMWFITGERRILRVFQLSMLLWLLAGPLGIILHYRANVAVERELDPLARGVPLMREALRGTMPALAPGTMFQLGLVGLLYTYRHPAVGAASRSTANEASG